MRTSGKSWRAGTSATLAAAALALASCAGDAGDEAAEAPSESDGPVTASSPGGEVEMTLSPGGRIAFDEGGTARYKVAWVAQADDDERCDLVLSVTDPRDQLLHSVPVTGCDSSMEMTLQDGARDGGAAGHYTVALASGDDAAEARLTVEQ